MLEPRRVRAWTTNSQQVHDRLRGDDRVTSVGIRAQTKLQINIKDSYDIFVMDNPDNYSGASRSDEKMAMLPGFGDRSDRLQQRSDFGSDSYDTWVSGNPDQESGF